MTFDIEANGRMYAVVVERHEGHPSRFRVVVNGRVHEVDCVQIGVDTLSLIGDGESCWSMEVGFSDGREPGEVSAYTRSLVVPLVVNGQRRRGRRPAAAGHGEQRIVAPMPGRVLRVLVAPGDTVVPRQPLVVVEAMKMENELSCARAGRVREVAVSTGMSVEAGRLLLTVE
ncbi:MAG: biotin/lipoyl-containing protein [Vicinamibacterales bacterium]